MSSLLQHGSTQVWYLSTFRLAYGIWLFKFVSTLLKTYNWVWTWNTCVNDGKIIMVLDFFVISPGFS